MKCFFCQQPMTTIHLLPDLEHTFTKKGYFQSTKFLYLSDGRTILISGDRSITYSQHIIDHAYNSVKKMSPTEHLPICRMILGAQLLLMNYPSNEAQTMLLERGDSEYNISKWIPSCLLCTFQIDLVPERSDLNFFISSDQTTFMWVD